MASEDDRCDFAKLFEAEGPPLLGRGKGKGKDLPLVGKGKGGTDLSQALFRSVGFFGAGILQEFSGATVTHLDAEAYAEGVFRCPAGHECERLTAAPASYPPGPVWCNRCSDNGIDSAHGFFLHCSQCQYDVCPRCVDPASSAPVGSTNVWLSPLSLALCLAMVTCGATEDSDTHKELRDALGHADVGPDMCVLERCQAVVDSMAGDGSDGVEISIANGIWSSDGIKEQFVREVASSFRAEVGPMPDNEVPINAFVEAATKGKIKTILPTLPPGALLVLLNAVYFKGDWAKKFDGKKTQAKDFYLLGGTVQCQMMQLVDTVHYVLAKSADPGGSDLQICRLRYGTSDYSAVIVLPVEWGSTSLSSLVAGLTPDSWTGHVSSAKPTKVHLQLPRFKLSSGLLDMEAGLRGLGVNAAWTGGFGRMGDGPLMLSCVYHAATCEVNEEGTVATAATVAVMGKGGKPAPPVEMECNRPFLFAIVHNRSCAPLFWGLVANPSE